MNFQIDPSQSFSIYVIRINGIYYISSLISGANPGLVGTYENLGYTESARNDFHCVNITYDSSNSVYLWKNRAGSEWKLHPTKKEDELRVDKSVNCYQSGWKIAKVTDAGIYGPGDELYTRMG